MRKWLVVICISCLFPFFLLFFLVIGLLGGDSVSTNPAFSFGAENVLERYQENCGALDVPWDLVYLIDSVDAAKNGMDSLNAYNPLITALEFCAIEELTYEAKEVPADSEEAKDATNIIEVGEIFLLVLDLEEADKSNSQNAEYDYVKEVTELTVPVVSPEPSATPSAAPSPSPTVSPSPSPSPEPEMVTIWILKDIQYYYGKDEILDYIGVKSEDDEKIADFNSLKSALKESAEAKNVTVKEDEVLKLTTMYQVILFKQYEIDYKAYLKDRGLKKKNINYIMDVYNEGYLRDVFGDGSQYLPTEPVATHEPLSSGP